MHCNHCGAEAEGRFCGACGATLAETECPGCGTPAPRGRRFCTTCGVPMGSGAGAFVGDRARRDPGRAGGSGGDEAAAWWVAGGLLIALLVVGGWALTAERGGGEAAASSFGMQPGQLGPAPNVDLSSMTPREAADRLFDRVMQGLAQRDTMEVLNFLPMAVDAYELARPLDLDGLFHLSLLQRIGTDHAAALDTAEEGLAQDPDHLLNLSAAAEAAREMGDADRAAAHYAHLLEVWDRERSRDDRWEYQEHAPLIPTLRDDAREFLEGHRGG